MRLHAVLLLLASGLGSCTYSGFAELSSLAEKPPLPYSVLVTGGGFVVPQSGGEAGPLGATYAPGAPGEAFDLQRLGRMLRDTNVFARTVLDQTPAAQRRIYAELPARPAQSAPDALVTLSERARLDGHDCILVVESILDGPIEARGINDRWPFTIATWLFALGALIPDLTYESKARLRLSIRDVYTGRRMFVPILAEPGPVDLNMFERCGFWGFVQSVIVPPFLTSTAPETITGSVSELSIDRILVSAVRRLKSAEVQDKLDTAGPATIRLAAEDPEWRLTVDAREPITAVEVLVDGQPLEESLGQELRNRLVASRRDGGSGYLYETRCSLPQGDFVKILVLTEAARISSITRRVGRR